MSLNITPCNNITVLNIKLCINFYFELYFWGMFWIFCPCYGEPQYYCRIFLNQMVVSTDTSVVVTLCSLRGTLLITPYHIDLPSIRVNCFSHVMVSVLAPEECRIFTGVNSSLHNIPVKRIFLNMSIEQENQCRI